MYFTWTSSSGASGSFQYMPGPGYAVPDEGNGGMTRRVVLAPGNANCEPFPSVTNNHRGQKAGIPYDRNVFVMVLGIVAGRSCGWNHYASEFGPTGANNADVAGFIWMMSDENPPEVQDDHRVSPHFGKNPDDFPTENYLTYPTASVARGPEPIGGLSMAAEIINGHRVDLFWPGTGPMTDTTERAALKDFMLNIDAVKFPYAGCGVGGSAILPAEFVADDSIDPCSNNGQGKHLHGVTCIDGHVVSISFHEWCADTTMTVGFPPSISGLTKLRQLVGHVYPVSPQDNFEIPCEFGQLENLVSFVWSKHTASPILEFPADDSCMNGLINLEEVMLGAFEMNRFPASFLGLPKMQKVSVRRAPIAELPATMSPDMRILRLSDVGASGPMPSFRNSTLLEEVVLAHNNLTLGDAGAFDYCPNLLNVDVSYNSISAAVFRFAGSPNVEAMDLSHNMIRGSIPLEWKELTSCKVTRVAHNLIAEPIAPLAKMNPAILDVSHNQIAWEDPSGKLDENGTVVYNIGLNHFEEWIKLAFSDKIAKADFSYNLLRQPENGGVQNFVGGTGGSKTWYPNTLQIDFSHNFLWGSVSLLESYHNWDLSHNEFTHVDLGSLVTGNCCDDRNVHGKTMNSVDLRYQKSSAGAQWSWLFYGEGLQRASESLGGSIDAALNNSLIDFKSVELMPRYNAFEQVEFPAGSGRYPYSCPTWFVDDRTERLSPSLMSIVPCRRGRSQATLNFYMDPDVYGMSFHSCTHSFSNNFAPGPDTLGYTGGSTAELRSRWFDKTDAEYALCTSIHFFTHGY
jgi:hypothetical protein